MGLQKYKNYLFELVVKSEQGENLFDVETVAKSLGVTQKKNGKSFVRWERVNEYLGENSPLVGKGDFISEPMVYKLAFKANNETAEKFQDWLALEVLPQIRKNGSYSVEKNLPTDPMDILKLTFQAQEQTNLRVDTIEVEVEDLKNNQKIGADDYGYISRRINQRVTEVGKGFGKLTPEQRGKLYKDINGGIKQVTGVGTRSQLREKHYQIVIDFINDWEPSTATKTVVRQEIA